MRKLDADTENEINKKRWERWRAKQKTEREKTCFYCWDNWSNWNNWSDVPDICASEDDCLPGPCKLCDLTEHSATCESDQKGHLYARGWEIYPGTILCPWGIGSECYAQIKVGKTNLYVPPWTGPPNFGYCVRVNVKLAGELRAHSSGGTGFATIDVYLDVYDHSSGSLVYSDKKMHISEVEGTTLVNGDTHVFISDIVPEGHYDVYARFYGHALVVPNASIENPADAYAVVIFIIGSYVEVIELGYEQCMSLP